MVKRYLFSILSYAISMLAIAISAVADHAVKAVMDFDKPVMASIATVCQIGRSIKTVYCRVIGIGSGESTACHGFVSMRRSLDASALA